MNFIPAKTILSSYRAENPWFGCHYNMNIYKGCSHGCIYCDSRSECYGVEHFDEVKVKEKALVILERELRSKRKKGIVGMGAMSDPYNPLESDLKLTRGALELIDRYRFGIALATKSDLVVRDRETLQRISVHSPVLMKMTITTADDELCQKIEPRVATSSRRFLALQNLTQQGIFCGVLLMPVLPFIDDSVENVVEIVRRAHESGASFVFPSFGVTLQQNQREWYYGKLDEMFPGLAEKYRKHYGNAYECQSPRSKELWQAFKLECDKRGVLYRMKDIISAYRHGYETKEPFLFE